MSEDTDKPAGDQFNFNGVSQNNSDGAVGQIGNNQATVNNNFGGKEPTLDDLLELLSKAKQVAIEENAEWPPDTPQALQNEFPTVGAMFDAATAKVEADISKEAYTIEPDIATGYAGPSDEGAPALGTPEGDFLAEKEAWYSKFNVLPPKVIQGGLVVGEAVLSCYVSKSPVVAGALAAIEFFKN